MKIWVKKVFGFGLASFLSDFGHEMTVSLIPSLVAQFVGIDQAPLYLGIIASLSDAFSSFIKLISGIISDRLIRKKPFITFGYFVSAVFSPLLGFMTSVWGILICRILSFTGSGLREPPRDALIASSVESRYYGRAFGLKNAMDTLGSLVGPLAALLCTKYVSIHWVFIISFIPGIAAVFAIIFLTYETSTVVHSSLKSAQSIKNIFNELPFRFLVFCTIIFVFDIVFFNKLLLLSRAQQILQGNGNIIHLTVFLYAVFNMTRAVAELCIGWVSDYINRITLLALSSCGLFSLVAYLLIPSECSFNYCIVIFMLAGIVTASSATLKKTITAVLVPPPLRGVGFGILLASEGGAALIANLTIGFLLIRYSPTIVFSYITIMSFIAMILLLIFNIFLNQRSKFSKY